MHFCRGSTVCGARLPDNVNDCGRHGSLNAPDPLADVADVLAPDPLTLESALVLLASAATLTLGNGVSAPLLAALRTVAPTVDATFRRAPGSPTASMFAPMAELIDKLAGTGPAAGWRRVAVLIETPCPFCQAPMQYAESSRYAEWRCTAPSCQGHADVPLAWTTELAAEGPATSTTAAGSSKTPRAPNPRPRRARRRPS